MSKIKALYVLFWLNFKRIYKNLPQNLRFKGLLCFAGMVVLACLEVATMLSISFLAMSIAAPEAAKSFGFMPYLIKTYPAMEAFFEDPRNICLFGSCYVVGLLTIKNITSYRILRWTTYFGEQASLYFGVTLFKNYLYSSYTDYLSGRSSQIHNVISMRGAVGQYMVACMNVYTYFFAFIALMLLLVSKTPIMLFSVLTLVGVTSIALYFIIKRKIDRDSLKVMNHSIQESQSLTNAIGGIREIIIYHQQPVFLDIFRKGAAAKMKPQTFLYISASIPPLALEAVGFLSIPSLVIILVYWYQAPISEIAEALTLIMLICWRVLPLLNRSLSSLVYMRSLQATAFTCVAELERLKECDDQESIPATSSPLHIARKISLDNVSFTYPGREVSALEGIHCEALVGRRIGIVGLSGAGKSTLAGVLAGLIAPTCGSMSVDGKPLTAQTLLAYRQRVGYVPQSAFIMEGTLAQNIAFSEWGKPLDERRVLQAAKLAALDFIDSTPEGIQMRLSPSSQLSGGQMQRVSIARALYAAPQVLILDESTSALDLATEKAILQTINNLPRDLIVFVIAHRLSTVENCDEIWWLKQGRLHKKGPAAEVLHEYTTHLATCSS